MGSTLAYGGGGTFFAGWAFLGTTILVCAAGGGCHRVTVHCPQVVSRTKKHNKSLQPARTVWQLPLQRSIGGVIQFVSGSRSAARNLANRDYLC